MTKVSSNYYALITPASKLGLNQNNNISGFSPDFFSTPRNFIEVTA